MLFFDPKKFLLIAGPCSLESESISLTSAERILKIIEPYPEINFVFSGSFDKANRTSLSSPRGPGLEKGLSILQKVKDQFHLPVITDIHLPEQASIVASVCEALQIPAFLCRQTDLLVAAAGTEAIINVKKGQFSAPQDMKFVIEKLKQSGANEIWLTERGSTFGYHNLVVDMRSFSIMKAFGHPVIFDATHAVQLPSASSGKSGGQREFITPLALASIASGAQGLYIETHPNPNEAISDGPSQIPLEELPTFIEKCIHLWKALQH